MNQQLLNDISGWDVETWGKFLSFLEGTGIDFRDKRVLEVGAGNGGLSLYFAKQGAKVVCTDSRWRDGIEENHRRNGVTDQIEYRQAGINDLSQYYENTFDIIVCKAVLGGIGLGGNGNLAEGVHEIYKCLKPGGYFIFCDSMRASYIHAAARKRFGSNWHYFTREEIMELCHEFTLISEQYYGYLAPFTRILRDHYRIRNFFGKVDSVFFEKILPDRKKYMGSFAFRKEITEPAE